MMTVLHLVRIKVINLMVGRNKHPVRLELLGQLRVFVNPHIECSVEIILHAVLHVHQHRTAFLGYSLFLRIQRGVVRNRVLEGHILHSGLADIVLLVGCHAVEIRLEQLRALRHISAIERTWPEIPYRPSVHRAVIRVKRKGMQTDIDSLAFQLGRHIPVHDKEEHMVHIRRVLTGRRQP